MYIGGISWDSDRPVFDLKILSDMATLPNSSEDRGEPSSKRARTDTGIECTFQI